MTSSLASVSGSLGQCSNITHVYTSGAYVTWTSDHTPCHIPIRALMGRDKLIEQ